MAKGLSRMYTCIHSHPNSLPSRLPHIIEQSSLCYTGGSCWLSIFNIHFHSHLKRFFFKGSKTIFGAWRHEKISCWSLTMSPWVSCLSPPQKRQKFYLCLYCSSFLYCPCNSFYYRDTHNAYLSASSIMLLYQYVCFQIF